MGRVTVVPETFTLVPYEAGVLAELAEGVAAQVGFPDGVAMTLEVDEGLPLPLTGSFADIVDGEARLWFSGGDFEDPHRTRNLDETLTRVWLGRELLRAGDRLSPGFADAPIDADLSDAQRAAWDVWADGRLARLGFPVREPLRRYHFRLASGFNDVSDTVYERLWSSDALTWAELDALCTEAAAVDTRAKPKLPHGRARDSLRI